VIHVRRPRRLADELALTNVSAVAVTLVQGATWDAQLAHRRDHLVATMTHRLQAALALAAANGELRTPPDATDASALLVRPIIYRTVLQGGTVPPELIDRILDNIATWQTTNRPPELLTVVRVVRTGRTRAAAADAPDRHIGARLAPEAIGQPMYSLTCADVYFRQRLYAPRDSNPRGAVSGRTGECRLVAKYLIRAHALCHLIAAHDALCSAFCDHCVTTRAVRG